MPVALRLLCNRVSNLKDFLLEWLIQPDNSEVKLKYFSLFFWSCQICNWWRCLSWFSKLVEVGPRRRHPLWPPIMRWAQPWLWNQSSYIRVSDISQDFPIEDSETNNFWEKNFSYKIAFNYKHSTFFWIAFWHDTSYLKWRILFHNEFSRSFFSLLQQHGLNLNIFFPESSLFLAKMPKWRHKGCDLA